MAKVFTSENFKNEVKDYEGKVLVDFWASWCGPCKMIAPIVEELAEELAGSVVVGKVNVDEEMELAEELQIASIPTLVVFDHGVPVNRLVGYRSKEELREALGV